MRKVLLWELLSGGKPYIILLILFLLLYVAMDYPPEQTGFSFQNLIAVLDIGWSVGELWWFMFPVVTALAVLVFSYDIDRGVLRTYMLSRVSRTSLFIGKLLAIFVAVLIPLAVSGAIILAFADPTLFLSNPLLVWSGLWLRLLGWALMMYTIIGFGVFSAVILRKPLYAFVAPYAVFYAISKVSIPASIGGYIPPASFIPFQYITPGNPLDYIERGLLYAWHHAWPSIAVATALLVISYLLFVKMEQP